MLRHSLVHDTTASMLNIQNFRSDIPIVSIDNVNLIQIYHLTLLYKLVSDC